MPGGHCSCGPSEAPRQTTPPKAALARTRARLAASWSLHDVRRVQRCPEAMRVAAVPRHARSTFDVAWHVRRLTALQQVRVRKALAAYAR